MEKFMNNKNEIGVDEAGRGPFFGPVYAAAVIWGDAPDNELIKDSKKLSAKKRLEAVKWIKDNVKDYGVGFCSNSEIDTLGILNATQLAMERAINNLKSENKDNKNIIIDGIGWEKREFNIEFSSLTSVVKGDANFRNIAAASILAKEAHDEHIINICSDNEEIAERYDLLKNKGYGTKKHIEGIKKYGLSEYHRQSFNINY